MGNTINTSWQLVESMQLTGGAKCDRSKDTWSVLMTTCHRSSSIRNVIVTGKSWQCTIHYDDICDFTILLMCVFNCCNKTQSVKASSFYLWDLTAIRVKIPMEHSGEMLTVIRSEVPRYYPQRDSSDIIPTVTVHSTYGLNGVWYVRVLQTFIL